MNLVYNPDATAGSIITPDENELHHLQVLRAHEGDALDVFDGKGNLYKGKLMAIGKKSATIQVIQLIRTEAMASAQLHIALAPTKNIERTEWFLEKAAEIGVHQISPVICRRSERRELRTDRMDKVLLSATKQSLHLHLPRLDHIMALDSFLIASRDSHNAKFIAHCGEHLAHLKNSFHPGQNITVLIGPEGDFSDEEVVQAKDCGFIPVSLGSSRLRTETAGVFVSAVFAGMQY